MTYICECGRELNIDTTNLDKNYDSRYRIQVHKQSNVHKRLMGELVVDEYYVCGCGVRLKNKSQIRYKHKHSANHRMYLETLPPQPEKTKSYECQCGSVVRNDNSIIKRHNETVKHRNYVSEKQEMNEVDQ